ncbi:hypothetical protein P7K49_030397 [Saguinus oedipus]|uniref:WD repeat-containing protein 6 n=1 Tax=Saguinus oedipus TaxID=9490 RepID=A0ABQ9U216_SAGOE|nr:hypothetical protein P7K49_030397 [Saguinus oedipus]
MDALEDYVWPRATSELILLPVTGLECVGDRLLADKADVAAAAFHKLQPARKGRVEPREDAGERSSAVAEAGEPRVVGVCLLLGDGLGLGLSGGDLDKPGGGEGGPQGVWLLGGG